MFMFLPFRFLDQLEFKFAIVDVRFRSMMLYYCVIYLNISETGVAETKQKTLRSDCLIKLISFGLLINDFFFEEFCKRQDDGI